MAGAVFVISADFAVHWQVAREVGYWESKRLVEVSTGDLLAFWVARRGLVGLCVAASAPDSVADVPAVRPWLPEDDGTYAWRYRFDLLLDHGLPTWSWSELMAVVGHPRRGANSAPVWLDDERTDAVLTALGVPQPASPGALERLLAERLPAAPPVGAADYVYVPEREDLASRRSPQLLVDADAYDRGLNAHARTQNAAARWLQEHGATILPPRLGVNSDLLWRHGEEEFVGEVKSLHSLNEREQLRLGLGQVLEFAYRLDASPVLIVEQEPGADFWDGLCRSQRVRLVWPGVFGRLTPPPDSGLEG